jgi:hypothetical protein
VGSDATGVVVLVGGCWENKALHRRKARDGLLGMDRKIGAIGKYRNQNIHIIQRLPRLVAYWVVIQRDEDGRLMMFCASFRDSRRRFGFHDRW